MPLLSLLPLSHLLCHVFTDASLVVVVVVVVILLILVLLFPPCLPLSGLLCYIFRRFITLCSSSSSYYPRLPFLCLQRLPLSSFILILPSFGVFYIHSKV